MPTRKFNENVILAAIQGFEVQKTQIDQQIAELRGFLSDGSRPVATTLEAAAPKRKKFSAAARRKMALSQKARWAKIRGESVLPAPVAALEPVKPKRKLSAAGRRAISEATKKRWALKRAEAAKKSAPARKKAAVKAPSAKAAKRAPAKRKAAAKTAPASAPTAQAAG
jgi:hypothetical protein